MDSELNKKISNLNFLSKDDIKNANFYELAIYMEKLNNIEKTMKIMSSSSKKLGENNE